MQELDSFDFIEDHIFKRRRFTELEPNKGLLTDDSMEVALMAELLHRGADANQGNELGWTFLHYAVAADCTRAIQLLVSAGADVTAQDPKGWMALHYAAAANRTEAIQLLVCAGADVNAQDGKGQTALFHASQAQQLAAADMLLSLGAQATTTDAAGQLPSIPFNTAQVQDAISALDVMLKKDLRLTRARLRKAQKPVVTSYQNQRTVPKSLRTGWPCEALQVMQSVDELQAQMLKENEQYKDALQAVEADLMQRMTQLQERLQSLEL